VEVLQGENSFHADSTFDSSQGLNPWVLKCHKQEVCLWDDLPLWNDVEKEFIVLENLVSQFKCPCVLDLKMGTRQYGDSVSLAKKQRKMVKVVTTTSAKLGMRVGGMQVSIKLC